MSALDALGDQPMEEKQDSIQAAELGGVQSKFETISQNQRYVNGAEAEDMRIHRIDDSDASNLVARVDGSLVRGNTRYAEIQGGSRKEIAWLDDVMFEIESAKTYLVNKLGREVLVGGVDSLPVAGAGGIQRGKEYQVVGAGVISGQELVDGATLTVIADIPAGEQITWDKVNVNHNERGSTVVEATESVAGVVRVLRAISNAASHDNVPTAKAVYDFVEAAKAALNQTLSNARADLTQQIDNATGRIDSLETAVQKLQQKDAEHSRNIDEHSQEIDALSKTDEDHARRLAELEATTPKQETVNVGDGNSSPFRVALSNFYVVPPAQEWFYRFENGYMPDRGQNAQIVTEGDTQYLEVYSAGVLAVHQ